MEPILPHLALGLLIRCALVAYSTYHDAISPTVKFTDIDYSVYSDAAAYVSAGFSPYLRETYRYTPILAFLLTPNSTVSPSYGKLLFCLFDILSCYLIYLVTLYETPSSSDKPFSLRCTYLWLYNPLPILICSRGSAESLIIAFVLATLYFVQRRATIIGGLLYGFSVHFKIYPMIYCLPLYLCSTSERPNVRTVTKKCSLLQDVLNLTPLRFNLVLGSVIGFLGPSLICWVYYGWEFLDHTYLYHLTRKDIRHNFSMYFYMLYLNFSLSGAWSMALSVATFLPQAILVIAVAVLFRDRRDLLFTCFIQTAVFVSFNKVVTSQYFLWYLALLPCLGPKMQGMRKQNKVILLFVWYFAQIAWLLPAYFLEFEGRNAFMYVWLESIAFFCANVGILVQVIKNYKP